MKLTERITTAIGVCLLVLGTLGAPPAAAQGEDIAQEVKRLMTNLTPRHELNMPTTIIVQRPVEIEIDTGTVIVDYGYTLDIEVQFEFDSARLTRGTRRSLTALGEALESGDLVDYDYLIAGHTDAKGSAAYNRALSYDRARAVRDFLIENFAINPRRLHLIGWGESRLKTPRHPLAAENRRVEVTLILPLGTDLRPSRHDDSNLTIRIVPAPGNAMPEGLDEPAKAGDQTLDDLTGLPPCPVGRLGDPRNPNADLDDFRLRPGIDCMPAEGSKVRITLDGDVIIE